ncbi:response regulator transcription factor [Angustibacter sp. Root456]|uniref:response regulator transcription factor n=1 Tax=Angustibacter sp. Root456 TaxID=1736539 RepID=UPI0006FEDA20|nr:response regulator transcription factor [Angustibacter sp. Root456]KQX62090.1 LuxR family transcriptional regulator [Angustibacter sp. Root456]
MTRVLIVDDEALVRAGLRMILSAADDLEVVAEAEDGADAIDAVRAHRPDVVLMDIRMPRLDGLRATQQVLELDPAPRVVVLTTFDLDDYVFRALEAGASGFLLKDTPPRDLVRAVQVVAAGEAMLSPTVTRRLIGHFSDSGSSSRQRTALDRLGALTAREREVLVAVARGLSNAEVGRELFMSEATVKAHVSRLLTKLDATNRVQVAIVAHDAGLV